MTRVRHVKIQSHVVDLRTIFLTLNPTRHVSQPNYDSNHMTHKMIHFSVVAYVSVANITQLVSTVNIVWLVILRTSRKNQQIDAIVNVSSAYANTQTHAISHNRWRFTWLAYALFHNWSRDSIIEVYHWSLIITHYQGSTDRVFGPSVGPWTPVRNIAQNGQNQPILGFISITFDIEVPHQYIRP